MKFLLYVGLLFTKPLSTTSDSADIQFLLQLRESYLCTGDNDWWKRIPDPMLRVTMQYAVLATCKTENNIPKAVRTLITDSRLAMKDKNVQQKRNEAGECLWNALKEWMLIPFICPRHYEELMEHYNKWLNETYDLVCNVSEKSDRVEMVCKITDWIIKHLEQIREVIERVPGLCENENSDLRTNSVSTAHHEIRQKRQYSTYTLVNAIRKGMCVTLEGQGKPNVSEFYSNSALVAHGEVPFVYSVFCCFFRFLEE